jgi:hypothetical protein
MVYDHTECVINSGYALSLCNSIGDALQRRVTKLMRLQQHVHKISSIQPGFTNIDKLLSLSVDTMMKLPLPPSLSQHFEQLHIPQGLLLDLPQDPNLDPVTLQICHSNKTIVRRLHIPLLQRVPHFHLHVSPHHRNREEEFRRRQTTRFVSAQHPLTHLDIHFRRKCNTYFIPKHPLPPRLKANKFLLSPGSSSQRSGRNANGSGNTVASVCNRYADCMTGVPRGMV